MKQKIDYWLDTLSPSLLFIAGFFVLFFVYFSWNLGIYSILAFLFILSSYFIFYKDGSTHEVLKLDDSILQQYEEYKRFFSISQEGMLLLVEDELQDANSNFEELVGVSLTSLRSREWLKLVHEEDILPFLDWVLISDENLDQSFLLRLYNHSNGELLWLKSRKRNIPTSSNKKVYVVSFKDVSDQRIYQEKALESQIQVYTLIDFAPMGVIIFDHMGKPEYVNKFGQSLIGYNRMELLQVGFSKLVSPEKYGAFLSEWEHYLKEGTDSFVSSTTMISKNNATLEVILNCVAVKNLEGKINSYFLTIVDLTETQKLASKNQFFVGLLNNSDAISIVDTNGIVVESNKLFEENLRLQKSDIVGKNYNKLFTGKYGLPESINSLTKDEVFRDEIAISFQDKTTWHDRTFIPYFSGDNIEHFYVIHRDITQRVMQEIEIKNKNKVLGFLTTAQNDFISSSQDKGTFKNILEKISSLKETSLSLVVEFNQEEGVEFSLLTSFRNQLYSSDLDEITAEEVLAILRSDNLFGNSSLFETALLINNLDSDFGPFEEAYGVKRVRNLISFPILKNQKVIALMVLVNSKFRPVKEDLKSFEPITTSLSTMIFAYKEIEIRNIVESQNLRLQEKISNQLQQLDQILRSSPDTYLMFDMSGKVEFISKKAIRFLESERYFHVGSSVYDLIKTDFKFAELFLDLFKRSLNEQNSSLNFSDHESGRDYLIEFIHIRNALGEIGSILCVIKDITEQKMYERELSVARDSAITASESKSEYLSSLHKELETPLSTLLNLVNMFEEKQLDDDKFKFISAFKKSANEINSHVERFFNLTVSPMDSLQISPATVKADRVLYEVLKENEEGLKVRFLKLSVHEHKGLELEIKSTHVELKNFFSVLIKTFISVAQNVSIKFTFEVDSTTHAIKVIVLTARSVFNHNELINLAKSEYSSYEKMTLELLNLKHEILSNGIIFSFQNLDHENVQLCFDFGENKALFPLEATGTHFNVDLESSLSETLEREQMKPVEETIKSALSTTSFRESALVFDHRADYLTTIENFLSEKSILVIKANSFSECMAKLEEKKFDYIFIDLSQSTSDLEGALEILNNCKNQKVAVSVPPVVHLNLKKMKFNGHLVCLPRPFRKNDLSSIFN